MNKSLLNSLRKQVISDIGEDHLPKGCFKLELEQRPNGRVLSWDEKWGLRALALAATLCNDSDHNTVNLSPRQYSATKVLYDLGELASREFLNNPQETEIQAKNNLLVSLHEYLEYLTEQEAKPFTSLLESQSEQPNQQTTPLNSVRYINKHKVATAFQGIYWNFTQWRDNLGDPPEWLIVARKEKGVRGNNKIPSKWDPIEIALALLGREITVEELNQAFKKPVLIDWASEWKERTYNES